MNTEKSAGVAEIVARLRKEYPDAHCALNHTNPLELLVATILSAQCTDERVNIVTAELFRKYRTASDYARASQEEMAEDIKSVNFFNNKAKAIRGAAQKLIDDYGGNVPRTMDELLTLNGVARKTANVVLGNAFGIASGVVVDTHVARISKRLGLTDETDAVKVERDLAAVVPKKHWVMFPHWLITHGRAVCKARNPNCEACALADICPKRI
jgi:endonuclease-3